MAEIKTDNWLDWHSGSTAQASVSRLICQSSAILPADNNLRRLMERQILDDVLILALHGRRQMEQNDLRSATMESDPIWPASQVVVAQETNLWKLFSSIVHAKEIKVIWEKADHLFGDNPYTGRIPQFAGSIEISVESKESKTINVSIGSMAASYVASVMNRRGE